MNRSQAIVISLLIGLVTLTFIGLVFFLLLPVEQVIISPPTPTFTPSPTVTPTATFPNFMPTPSFTTPTPAEPTPTNTRLPTATSGPTNTPQPTVVLNFPEPIVRPTATSLPPPPVVPPVSSTTVNPTPTIGSRGYSITFDAANSTITEGDCTNLRWNIQGAVTARLEGEQVNLSGTKEVCPGRETTYVLTTQLQNSPQIERHTVSIKVVQKNDDDDSVTID
ncbi:MAG: hypothetical protein KDJ65_22470 [Anaerolineae bacterium]|nr:hypothetical protein [Anaerolineae bacterium]